MEDTLEQFGASCREILKRDPRPEALKQLRTGLEELLVDEAFLSVHLIPDDDRPRRVIYEDPELGFCVVTLLSKGSNEGPPHDHGPTWAIYGLARGNTVMTDYRIVEASEDGKPGKVESIKSYDLQPGKAIVYDIGHVHSPQREGETWLLRIEGIDTMKIKRTPYVLA